MSIRVTINGEVEFDQGLLLDDPIELSEAIAFEVERMIESEFNADSVFIDTSYGVY